MADEYSDEYDIPGAMVDVDEVGGGFERARNVTTTDYGHAVADVARVRFALAALILILLNVILHTYLRKPKTQQKSRDIQKRVENYLDSMSTAHTLALVAFLGYGIALFRSEHFATTMGVLNIGGTAARVVLGGAGLAAAYMVYDRLSATTPVPASSS